MFKLILFIFPFKYLNECVNVSPLSERVGQELDFDLRTDTLVQYIIYGIENRHVDVHVAVDFLHALRAEISFGNHLHLYLRTFHAIALAYHSSEGAVAGEVAVTRYEQVAQIYRIVHTTVDRVDGCEEAMHLLYGVRHEYRLEVVTILQTTTDTCCNGTS